LIRLLDVEIRRCLARRLVRWLVVLAVVACALIAFVARQRAGVDEMTQPFRLVDLHEVHGESILGVAVFFLVIGASVGGASMVGAEWRAGTFVTLLSWEPHRRRVAVAKLAACGLVATVIGLVLQVLFMAAFLPAALGPGTTEGVDAEWWRSLAGVAMRGAVITGLVAVLMAAVAMIGRSTATALGFAFGYVLLVENLLRAWKPWSARYLMGENAARFLTGVELEDVGFTRSTVAAAATLVTYVAVAALVAVVTFWRRDLASAT
jgi:hypothetical protein